MNQEAETKNEGTTPRKLADYLAGSSFGIELPIIDATAVKVVHSNSVRLIPTSRELEFRWPRVMMYCPHCDGPRYFSDIAGEKQVKRSQELFISYICKNCTLTIKTYALRIRVEDTSAPGITHFLKFGEFPTLDEKLPNRLLSLVGKDRQLFLQGRRSERAGLGIGAFGYYRRVVENQKSEILTAVAEAARLLGHEALADEIVAANTERQFASAIDKIKHALPESLRVGGHDPLRILHSALSEGLHSKDDQHCLDYAETIREVLGALAERIAHAKQDEARLRQSIGRLLRQAESEASSKPE